MRGEENCIGRPVEGFSYDSLPYKIDSMVNEDFGSCDINNMHTFGDKILSSTGDSDLVHSIGHTKVIGENNVKYDVGFMIQDPETWNIISYAASYTMSEGEIIDADLTGYFSLAHDDSEFKQPVKHINALISMIEKLIPNSTITLVSELDTIMHEYQITYTYLGIEKTENFVVYVSSEDVSAEFDAVEDHSGHHH